MTDGHEYAANHLGATVTVLDNLIADGKLRPTIAVFVDPRNPFNSGQNRRAGEYITNRAFADFLAEELVPQIDATHRTLTQATGRTILGTSLGGLNSAYVGATHSDVFENLAIQSPAFWASPGIYDLFRNADLAEQLDIYMTNGSGIAGDNGGATIMAGILDEFGYDHTFTTANQGHSWGQWRGQIDEALIRLVGPPIPEPATGAIVAAALGLVACRRRAAR
ncbi:MAG: alpha/beta hydrolase-fold protein [Planctomycetota bacterium]